MTPKENRILSNFRELWKLIIMITDSIPLIRSLQILYIELSHQQVILSGVRFGLHTTLLYLRIQHPLREIMYILQARMGSLTSFMQIWKNPEIRSCAVIW